MMMLTVMVFTVMLLNVILLNVILLNVMLLNVMLLNVMLLYFRLLTSICWEVFETDEVARFTTCQLFFVARRSGGEKV